jgi:hypothetical protein
MLYFRAPDSKICRLFRWYPHGYFVGGSDGYLLFGLVLFELAEQTIKYWMRTMMPRNSPKPTAVGAASAGQPVAAVAVYAGNWRWLSFFRLGHIRA